jgi:hypothetical protein
LDLFLKLTKLNKTPKTNQKIEALKVEIILPDVFKGHTKDKNKIKEPSER